MPIKVGFVSLGCPKNLINTEVMLAKLVDTDKITETVVFSDADSIPVWARDEIGALCAMGIISCEGDMINGNTELTKESAGILNAEPE